MKWRHNDHTSQAKQQRDSMAKAVLRDRPAPHWAVVCFKVVAVMPNGRNVSIYDGTTEYREQRAVFADTGLYVSSTVVHALEHTAVLPAGSVALDNPRRVCRCLCWNNDFRERPHQTPSGSSFKLRFQNVLPLSFSSEPFNDRPATAVHSLDHSISWAIGFKNQVCMRKHSCTLID